MNGKIIREFIGLRSKMYSIKLFEGDGEIKKAKGIPGNVVKNEIDHKSYRDSLLNRKQANSKFATIRSKKHQLSLLEINKKSLCPGDDKRWIEDDGIHTLAHGHYLAVDDL